LSKSSGSSKSHSSSNTQSATKDTGTKSSPSKGAKSGSSRDTKSNSSSHSSSRSSYKTTSSSAKSTSTPNGSKETSLQNAANKKSADKEVDQTTSKTNQKELPPEKQNNAEKIPVKTVDGRKIDNQTKPSDESNSPDKAVEAVSYEEFMRTYNPGAFKTTPLEVPLKKRGRKQGLAARSDAPVTLPKPNVQGSKASDGADAKGCEAAKNKSPPCETANMSAKKRFKFLFSKDSKESEDAAKADTTVTSDITNGSVKKPTT